MSLGVGEGRSPQFTDRDVDFISVRIQVLLAHLPLATQQDKVGLVGLRQQARSWGGQTRDHRQTLPVGASGGELLGEAASSLRLHRFK